MIGVVEHFKIYMLYIFSVYLHYLHVVDADTAPVTGALGAKCAHSTLCVVKGDEQEIIKIPCGTKLIGQMDRTKEKEKMQKKEAEAPFQEARQPPRTPKARLIKKSPCGFWVSPFRILQVLVLFWSVPYVDGFQLEMVGALSASLDHHCPSGFLCRASFHGLAQPWLGNASAETDGDESSSGYLFSSDCEDFAPFDAEGFTSVDRELFVGLPRSSQLYFILAGAGLPAQLRMALAVLLGQFGLGLLFSFIWVHRDTQVESFSCGSLASPFDPQNKSQLSRRRGQSRRVVFRCRWVGKAREKQARLRYRRRSLMIRLRRLHYWSLGRRPRPRPVAQSCDDCATCGSDLGADLKAHDGQDFAQGSDLGTWMREILQPVLNVLLCIGWNPYLAVRVGEATNPGPRAGGSGRTVRMRNERAHDAPELSVETMQQIANMVIQALQGQLGGLHAAHPANPPEDEDFHARYSSPEVEDAGWYEAHSSHELGWANYDSWYSALDGEWDASAYDPDTGWWDPTAWEQWKYWKKQRRKKWHAQSSDEGVNELEQSDWPLLQAPRLRNARSSGPQPGW